MTRRVTSKMLRMSVQSSPGIVACPPADFTYTLRPHSVALPPGTRLGPYEILAPLGAGGMGEVYKARDTRLDRTVAIKVLPAALAADPQFRERFEREARAISRSTIRTSARSTTSVEQDGTDVPRHGVSRGRDAGRPAGEGRAAADQALQYRDRRSPTRSTGRTAPGSCIAI